MPRANLQFTNPSGRIYNILSFFSGPTLLQFRDRRLAAKYWPSDAKGGGEAADPGRQAAGPSRPASPEA